MSHLKLIEVLKKRSVRWGSFTLASGKQSDFYVDARLTTLSPEGIALITQAIYPLIREAVTVVGGPVTGAIPIVGATILRAEQQGRTLSGFMVRKAVKGHGTGNMVEGLGSLPAGSKVCMVEDTVTTAGSLVKAIRFAEKAGLNVIQCIAIVDREEGAQETMAAAGFELLSLTTKTELMA